MRPDSPEVKRTTSKGTHSANKIPFGLHNAELQVIKPIRRGSGLLPRKWNVPADLLSRHYYGIGRIAESYKAMRQGDRN